MNERDKYISDMLDKKDIRPKRGHLLCEKLVFGKTVEVDGLGEVTGDLTESGLVVVARQDTQDEAVLAKLLVVRAVGTEPSEWRFRFFGKEFNWGASWKDQGIEEGVVIAVRSIAGVEQDITDRFIEVRYDEISAIGQVDPNCPYDMLPAPGWCMVDIGLDDLEGKVGSLYVRPEMQEVLEGDKLKWGTLCALAKGANLEGVEPGNRVAFDRYRYTEYMDCGKYRFLPLDELLVVEYE